MGVLLACGPSEACTKLVQRISCLGVVLAREKGGAHEIGTQNFVLGDASPAKKWGCLGMLLACGPSERRRGKAFTKLV